MQDLLFGYPLPISSILTPDFSSIMSSTDVILNTGNNTLLPASGEPALVPTAVGGDGGSSGGGGSGSSSPEPPEPWTPRYTATFSEKVVKNGANVTFTILVGQEGLTVSLLFLVYNVLFNCTRNYLICLSSLTNMIHFYF